MKLNKLIATSSIEGGIQAVLHVGDIAYDLRQDAGRIGDEFLRDMQPVASAVPYMVCWCL